MPLHYHPLCPNAPSLISYLIHLYNQQIFNARDRRGQLRKRARVPVLMETTILSDSRRAQPNTTSSRKSSLITQLFWVLHPPALSIPH